MKTKNIFRNALMASTIAILTATTFTACSNDNNTTEEDAFKVVATIVGNNTIKVSWNAIGSHDDCGGKSGNGWTAGYDTYTHYHIYYTKNSDTTKVFLNSVWYRSGGTMDYNVSEKNGTCYLDTTAFGFPYRFHTTYNHNVSIGGTYCYYVKARNYAGSTDFSKPGCATIMPSLD